MSLNKAFKLSKSLYAYFIDLRKAFDTVNREALLCKLSHYKLSGCFFNILKNMYDEVKYSIKFTEGETSSFVSLWWVCLICIICMVLHVVARDKLWRLIKRGYKMGCLYDIVSRLLTVIWRKRKCWSPALIMSEVETDHESDRINNTGGTDNDLTTDGAISLFTSALNNALDRQKATLIEHFENISPRQV